MPVQTQTTSSNNNQNNRNNSTPNTAPHHHKDNMSIGSAESLAPRWVSPEAGGNASHPSSSLVMGGTATTHALQQQQPQKQQQQQSHGNIHWVGVLRDETMLAEYCNEPDNPKILQMSRRFLKSSASSGASPTASRTHNNNTNTATSSSQLKKVDWEFKTYAVQSQRRMVHAVKFYIYTPQPFVPGARAKLRNLQAQSFLNGETVRIIEYQASTDKYLIRPSIPLPEAQKLATTGMLVVHSKHLVPLYTHGNTNTSNKTPSAAENAPPGVRVWTVAALYDGKRLTQNVACQFLEKILLISESFRKTDAWMLGTEMSAQSVFAPILATQMDQFMIPAAASIDESLEYTKELIAKNKDVVQLHFNQQPTNTAGSVSSTASSSVNPI